jgi:hypothetical protein
MALNLSTLTSPATSGDVLAEALTTADFLEPVPVLRNLSRGSNKGGDAKQSVSLNQPRALPLIKNPAGDLGGYLYIPDVAGNYAEGPSVTIGSNETWEAEVDMVVTQFGNYVRPLGGGDWASGFGLLIYSDGDVRAFSKSVYGTKSPSGVTLGTPFNAKYGYDGTNLYVDINDTRVYTILNPDQSGSITHTLELNQQTLNHAGNYAIQKAKLTVNSSVVFDCDFNGSTSIRHGDTKFTCATGQVVTINKSGNDPSTIIKKPVLRFDGVNSSLRGLFNQTITDGYMFAAFSVLGDGGEDFGRILSVNSTGENDNNASGAIFSLRNAGTTTLDTYLRNDYRLPHVDLLDDENGDILHEAKITNGSQSSLVNNADLKSTALATSISSEEFNVCVGSALSPNNAAIDLEYLALFPASITDAQADAVRNYINKRNTVYLRHHTDGYYFYNPQDLTSGAVTSWNGRIVGSDNGDTDKFATQTDANDQPVGDGYVVTFADNSDHLDIPQVTLAAGDSYAWMVCGTSLGTFAYKVTVSGETELNLLGHLGDAAYRKTGDLYGIILLPATATGRDIEQARRLLIDRGAADGTTSGSLFTYWSNRQDIVEFKHINTSSAVSMSNAWFNCQSLSKFPLIDTSNVTNFNYTFFNSNLESFPAIQAPVGTVFTNTWQKCSALTSFPADAKLGTEASNVNFSSAWKASGLTSFPALDLSNGNNFLDTWRECSSLQSFAADAKLGTDSSNVNFESAWRDSGLTSFSTPLPTATRLFRTWQNTALTSFSSDISSATNAFAAWRICTSLTSFNAALPLVTDLRFGFDGCSSLPSFDVSIPVAITMDSTWLNCSSLTDFSADVFSNWNPSIISSGVFNNTWDGCPLTAQSVENILVSIDASGKYATSTGLSGGSALADAGIDIDYNVATGSLSVATTAAIDSLSGKGWQVYINGELVIPNILDLEPAAAYSLRSFDADADPNVVNVRRSSDNATSDFKASEVSDGTLTSWVNTEYETVTNGEFATDSVWVKGSGWGIANGKATSDGTQTGTSYLYQLASMGASQSQRVTLVVSGYVAGTVKVRLGDSAPASSVTPDLSSNGTYVFTLPSHSTTPYLFLQASSDFQGSIESISVVQLTSDGHVTTWYDQGGTNHATQATASSQPKIVDGGTLVTDSANNPAIIGDGVDDTLFHPTLTNELDSSDFLVTAAYQDELTMGITGSIPRLYLTNSSMAYNTLGTVGYPTQAGRNVMSFQVAGNTQEVFGNGTSIGTASEAQVDIGQNMFNVMQGGSAFSDGPLMEVIVFGDNQSANRTGIEANIMDTYSIS